MTGSGLRSPTGRHRRGDGASDVDEDGFDDLLIGGGPEVCLVFGPVDGTLASSDLPVGFVDSEEAGLGYSVTFAGDIDANGTEDILLGGIDASNGLFGTGAAYLFLNNP